MNYNIREMKEFEYPLLEEFLYEAIFQRNESNMLPREIINKPSLQVYVKDFGLEKDDYCLCAEVGDKIIGVVWVRNISGFGSIDKDTPEFAISLFKGYRGKGIGTDLMKHMLKLLKSRGYKKTSLAVQKDNYALQMYKNVGFTIVDENEEEFTMEYYFKQE